MLEVRRAPRAVTSLDAPVGEDGGATLGSLLDEGSESPETQVDVALREATVRRALETLPDPQRRVIEMRFGVDGDPEPKSVREVSRELGMTASEVQRIENKALVSLSATRELQSLDDEDS